MEKSYWGRIGIFFEERFPLFLSGMTTLVGTISLYIVWVAMTDGAALVFNKSLVLAFFSFFCLIILLKLFEELKEKDIEAFMYGIALIWIPVNFIFGQADIVFTILMIYVYLFYKSFYYPEKMSNNLLLALLTRSPIMLIGSFYMLSLFSVEQGTDSWTLNNFMLALAFWMLSLAWETSKHLCGIQDKNNDETFPKLTLPQVGALLPIGASFIQMVALIYIVRDLQYGMNFLLGNVTIFFLYFMVFLTFMVRNKMATAIKLKQTTEAYIICISALLIVISGFEIIK